MSFDELLKAARVRNQIDRRHVDELARAALAQQREDEVLPLLAKAAASGTDPFLWQWKGVLERALDEHGDAIRSFGLAQKLAPSDPVIAHGLARVVFEAGAPAVDLFARALQLAPNDPHVYLGFNAARMADGLAGEAERDLERVLERSPTWLDGHHQLAQLKSQLGKRSEAFDSLDRAIAVRPGDEALWRALFELQVIAEDYPLLEATLSRARAAGVRASLVGPYAFIAASELGQTSAADAIVKGLGATAIPAVWLVRYFLRNGRLDRACTLIDSGLNSSAKAEMWPYATIAWRLSGDSRFDWLAGNPNLISVIDLGAEVAAVPGLADLLRRLHAVSGRYLDQSVRGGSQTDGPLLSRVEPEIRAVRGLIVAAVRHYATSLGNLAEGHPQKPPDAGKRVRFSGSWSVRLAKGGFHTSHVHPRGWISSALYISLPSHFREDDGRLVLGEPPPELMIDLPPTRVIEPKVGRLVLFPSWMWHGTRTFPTGERLTVAFDVAP